MIDALLSACPLDAGTEARRPLLPRVRAGSRAARLAMVFKLIESAQARRRALNGAHLVPLVRVGARFERGQLVERPELMMA